MTPSNLPPGVTEGMIPGNRPEDAEWEALIDQIYEDCPDPWEARRRWESHPDLFRLLRDIVDSMERGGPASLFFKEAKAVIAEMKEANRDQPA